MAINGRLYTVSFNSLTLTAVSDLFALYSGASKLLAVHSVNIGQVTGATVVAFRLRFRALPPTVTPGSGGAAATPALQLPGDAAATFTARVNDTTQATTTGAAVTLWDDVWNTVQGYYWQSTIAGRPFVIGLSSAFIVSLDQAPSSFVANGSMVVEELP